MMILGLPKMISLLHAGNIDDGMETMIETMIVYINILADSREAKNKNVKKNERPCRWSWRSRIVRSILEDEKNVNDTSA